MRAGVVAVLAVIVGSAWYLCRANPTLYTNELNAALQFVSNTWELFKPGGKLHPAYFLENQGHTAIEASLVVVIVLLYFQRRFKPKSRSNDPLTEKVRSVTLMTQPAHTYPGSRRALRGMAPRAACWTSAHQRAQVGTPRYLQVRHANSV